MRSKPQQLWAFSRGHGVPRVSSGLWLLTTENQESFLHNKCPFLLWQKHHASSLGPASSISWSPGSYNQQRGTEETKAGAGSLLSRVCKVIWLWRQGGSRSTLFCFHCYTHATGASWCPPQFVSSRTVCCVAKATSCICTAAPGLPLNETVTKNSSLPQSPKSFCICVHECMCLRVCVNVYVHTHMCVCIWTRKYMWRSEDNFGCYSSGDTYYNILFINYYCYLCLAWGRVALSQCAWHQVEVGGNLWSQFSLS